MDIVAENEVFRQLKLKLRKDEDILIVGVDAGKQSSMTCFYSLSNDILIKKYHVPHTKEGLDAFVTKIEYLKVQHSLSEVVIGFEPTGNYHKIVAEYLRKQGYRIVYVSSVVVKNNRRTLFAGRWGKNDPRDAYNVVDLMRQGKIQFYRAKDTRAADIRSYLRLHRRLTVAKAALKIRVRNNLWACHFPELDDLFNNVEDPDVLCLLEHYCSTQELRAMGYSSFIKLFPPTKPSQHKRRERIESIWEAAQTSLGGTIPPSARFEAKGIARDIRIIQNDLCHINAVLEDYCNEPDSFRYLLTMPAFGPFTTAVFKACIEDIHAFQYPRQLEKLAGIDVESMTSGSYSGKEKISKKGMSLLRYALCQAVSVAVSRNKKIRALFEAKAIAAGNTKSARAKLKIKFASRFLRTAFTLLKNNEPFDFQRFNVPVNDPVLDSVRA